MLHDGTERLGQQLEVRPGFELTGRLEAIQPVHRPLHEPPADLQPEPPEVGVRGRRLPHDPDDVAMAGIGGEVGAVGGHELGEDHLGTGLAAAGPPQVIERGLEHGEEDLVLALEVPVEVALRDAGQADHVGDAGRAVATLGEDGARRVDEAGPGGRPPACLGSASNRSRGVRHGAKYTGCGLSFTFVLAGWG